MKTLEYWLSQLDEPNRSKALEHCKRFGRLQDNASTLHYALAVAFIWGDTPETFKHWFDLFLQLKQQYETRQANNG